MNSNWYIICKIKVSEDSYNTWLSSPLQPVANVIYDDCPDIKQSINVRKLSRDITSERITPADFFAYELSNMKIHGNEKVLKLNYNKKHSLCEFICNFSSNDYDLVIDFASVISTLSNYLSENEKNFCTISLDHIDNIACMIEIKSKSITILPENDYIEAMPEDLKDFFNSVYKDIFPNNPLDNNFDKEILSIFKNIVSEDLSIGIEKIIESSSESNLNYISKDGAYLTDGKQVYNIYGRIIPEANPKTFISCSTAYSKDDKNVYYGTDIIEGADTSTFKALKWHYAIDKYNAYYKGIHLCAASNFSTYRSANGYASDGNVIFYNGKEIEGSSAGVFRIICGGNNKTGIPLVTDSKNIYAEGRKLDYIDVETIEYIDHNFYKDKKNVYYGKEIIDGCNSDKVRILNNFYVADDKNVFFIKKSHITILLNANPNAITVNGQFAVDNKNVYYKGEIIENADCSTIKLIEDSNYICDSKSVFYTNKQIAASPENFEVLGYGYSKSGSRIFFRDKLIRNADVNTFRPTGYGYAADKFAKYRFDNQYSKKFVKDMEHITGNYYKDLHNVYYHSNIIPNADVASFTYIPKDIEDDNNNRIDYYAKDKNHIYFMGKKIDNADPDSFRLFSVQSASNKDNKDWKLYAKDKNYVYFIGEPIANADPNTFKSHEIDYVWVDKNYTFINGDLLSYIDNSTFQHIEYSFYSDKNCVYYETDPIKNFPLDNIIVLGSRYIISNEIFCYVEKTPTELITNFFEAHANSFDIAESEPVFSFDKDHMFFRGEKIPNINMASATILGDNYVKDKSHVYYGINEIANADPTNFTFLGDGYAYDGKHSFYMGIQLKTNQIIHPLGESYATDGKLFWKKGIIIEDPEKDEYISNTLGSIL